MEPSDDLADLRPKASGGARTIMVLGFTLPAALGAGVLLGMYLFGSPRGGAPPVASVAKPPPSAAPSAAPPPTPLELAASGDYKMLDELKSRAADQRTAEETLALARGRSHNKSAALEGFGKEIKKNADFVKDKNQLQRLRDSSTTGRRRTRPRRSSWIFRAPSDRIAVRRGEREGPRGDGAACGLFPRDEGGPGQGVACPHRGARFCARPRSARTSRSSSRRQRSRATDAPFRASRSSPRRRAAGTTSRPTASSAFVRSRRTRRPSTRSMPSRPRRSGPRRSSDGVAAVRGATEARGARAMMGGRPWTLLPPSA